MNSNTYHVSTTREVLGGVERMFSSSPAEEADEEEDDGAAAV
jgi:hypothetical protein